MTRADRLTLVVLAGLAVAVGFIREFSGDFHWHVVQGAWMLDHHQVLRADPFSYTAFGQHEYTDAWLGDIALALAFRAASYAGCYALRGAALALTCVVAAREMMQSRIRATTAAVLMSLWLGELAFRLYLRPEIFTFPLIAWIVRCLGTHERTGRWQDLAIALPAITLWSNVHASVDIALLAVGLYAAQLFVRALRERAEGGLRRRILLAVALPTSAFLASTINSQGLREPLMFLTIHANDPTFSAGVEWGPLFLVTMTPAFPALVCGILAILALSLPKVSWWRLGIVLLLGYAATQHGRFVKMFLLTGAMAVAHHLPVVAARLEKRARLRDLLGRGLTALGAVVAALLIFGYHSLLSEVGFGLDAGAYPVTACDEARTLPLSGEMWNSFDAGSYLMFCLPQHRLMLDQRAAELYSPAFHRHVLEASSSVRAMRELAAEWNVGWAFVLTTDDLGPRMDQDPATWQLVYFDDEALIYVDRHRNPELAASGLRLLHPTRVGHLLFTPAADLPEAERELAVLRHQTSTGTTSRLFAAAIAFAHDQPVATGELDALALHHPHQGQLRRAIIALQRGDAESAYGLLVTLVPPDERALLKVEVLARTRKFEEAERMLKLVPNADPRARAYLDERRR